MSSSSFDAEPNPVFIIAALKIVLSNPTTRGAASHIMAHEVGSALQRNHAAWNKERQSLEKTLEQEMNRQLLKNLNSPAAGRGAADGSLATRSGSETVLRHEKLVETFSTDLCNRRVAVQKATRRSFISWLFAAAEGLQSGAAGENLQLQQRDKKASGAGQQQPVLPIDYGREASSCPATMLSLAIIETRSHAAATMAVHANDRNRVLLCVSPIESLPHCIPVINEDDAVDSKEAAARALTALVRYSCASAAPSAPPPPAEGGSYHSTGIQQHAVIIYFGSRTEFHERILAPVSDFEFDLFPETAAGGSSGTSSSSSSLLLSQKLKTMCDQGEISVERVCGFFGVTIAVCIEINTDSSSPSGLQQTQRETEVIREVLDSVATCWQATNLSIVFSPSSSNAFILRLGKVISAELRRMARDISDSVRQAQTTIIAPLESIDPHQSAAVASPGRSTVAGGGIAYHATIGMAVRAFLPRYSSGSLLTDLVSATGASVLWNRDV